MTTSTRTKRKKGAPFKVRRCDLCKKSCGLNAWCFGCRNNVCAKCDKHPSLRSVTRQQQPLTPHKLADHKVEHLHDVYARGADGDIPF